MKNNYNPEYPLDNIKVREIPSVIRNKGEQIINYFKDIENSRVTNSFSNISELINFLFITNNIDLNSGIYIKNDNYWIGVSTIDELPTNIEKEKDLRLTINSNSYSLKNINENYVFALSNNINPFCYYDLFNLNVMHQVDKRYRTDKAIIEAVKSLGLQKSSGSYCDLKIVKIPKHCYFTIVNYLGKESIMYTENDKMHKIS